MNNSNSGVRIPQKFKFEFDVNIQEWKANSKSLLLLTSSEIREIISSHGYDLKSYFYKKDDLLNKLKDILNGTSNNGMNGGISISINSTNTTPTISPKLTSSNSNINSSQYNGGNSTSIISNSSNIQYSNNSVPYYNNNNNSNSNGNNSYNNNKRSIEQVHDPYELQIASDDECNTSSSSINGNNNISNNNSNNSNNNNSNSNIEYPMEYTGLPPKKKFSTSPTNTSAQTSTNTSPIQQNSTIQLFKTNSITQSNSSNNLASTNIIQTTSPTTTLNSSTTGINTLSNLSLSTSSNNLSTLASCSLNKFENINNNSNNNNNNNTCNGNNSNINNQINGNNHNNNHNNIDKNTIKRALELEQRILGSFSFYFMMKKLDYSIDFSLRVQEEFVRFMVLKVMDNDHGGEQGFGTRLIPSPIIDNLYREIILNTIKHKELLNLLKFEIHYHSTHNESQPEKEKKYQRTLNLYNLYFYKYKNADHNEIIWPSSYTSNNYNNEEELRILSKKARSLKSKNREKDSKIDQLEKEILKLKKQLNIDIIEEELNILNSGDNNENVDHKNENNSGISENGDNKNVDNSNDNNSNNNNGNDNSINDNINGDTKMEDDDNMVETISSNSSVNNNNNKINNNETNNNSNNIENSNNDN